MRVCTPCALPRLGLAASGAAGCCISYGRRQGPRPGGANRAVPTKPIACCGCSIHRATRRKVELGMKAAGRVMALAEAGHGQRVS